MMLLLLLPLFFYILIMVAVAIAEPNMVYPERGKLDQPLDSLGGIAEPTFFVTDDGVKIRGLFLACPESRGVILFCHGNAEWLQRLDGFVEKLGAEMQINVLAFDYRGYGESEGSPNERGLIKDGLAAYDYLLERGFAPGQIIVYGRSLGGAVACGIAAEKPVGGLILHNTFSSMVDVAQSKFPWLPVRWIMRNRFDSASRLRRYQGPLLQSHGDEDQIVPIRYGRKLFENSATADDSRFFLVDAKSGHNDPWSADFREHFQQFLHRVLHR